MLLESFKCCKAFNLKKILFQPDRAVAGSRIRDKYKKSSEDVLIIDSSLTLLRLCLKLMY